MGKEWYINGWGRDNMEYWAPARAGGQCSILYTTPVRVPPPNPKYLADNACPASFITVPPIGPVHTKPPDAIVNIDAPLT